MTRAFYTCLLALLVVACGGQKPAETPRASSDAPKPNEPGIVGDGFYIDFPVWHRTEKSVQKGLTAKYKWGSSEERTTKGTSGGSYWRVTFPDRPKPSDVAKVELQYEFDLTDDDKKQIEKAVESVIAKTLEVMNGEGTLDARIIAGSPAIAAAAKPLANFRTASGTKGDELILKLLGFRKRADGSFELPDTKTIAEIAQLSVVANEASREPKVKAAEAAMKGVAEPTPPTDCSKGIAAIQGDAKRANAARTTCAQDVAQQAKTNREALEAKYKTPTEAQKTEIANAKGTEAAAAEVAKRKRSDSDLDLVAARVTVGGDAKIRGSYAWLAFDFADAAAGLLEAKEQIGADRGKRAAQLKAELESRIEIMQRDELGSVLLQAAGERRRYDVSTGVVYVAGVEDVVMPILIAACPLGGGCLRQGETIVDNALSALSVDVGIKARTLDTVDPRQRDALSFLIGASLNPIYFLRISGGFYTFENAQRTDHWNVTGYAGVTVNMLQAAELFGVIGLGTPSPPKIVGQ